MNSADLSQRIDRVLTEFQIPSGQRAPLRLALIREVAQAQVDDWMQVATTPGLATLSIRDLKAKAKAALASPAQQPQTQPGHGRFLQCLIDSKNQI